MDEIRLTDRAFLRETMQRFGIVTKKKYGQNFLINEAIPRRIALEGCPNPCDGVLEIGPGMGTLTYELCKRAKKVVALEIDKTLLPVLEYTLGAFSNVKVLLQDALQTDLAALCKEEFSDCDGIRVCANLPYYITTPVLMYLLESGVPFKSVTVMVQKEVADRLTAKAGSSDYGAITAAVGYFGRAEKLFIVSPGSFLPAPSVESCVIRIDIHRENPYAECDRALLMSLIKAAFGQRRKTLNNTLKGILQEEEREWLPGLLAEMGFPPDVRGERLDISDYAVLCRALQKKRAEQGSPQGIM